MEISVALVVALVIIAFQVGKSCANRDHASSEKLDEIEELKTKSMSRYETYKKK